MGPKVERWAFVAILVMTAVWGSTFYLIKDIVTRVPVADLLAVRFAVAGAAMVLIGGRHLRMSRQTLARGALLGLLYGLAQILQTFGLAHTSASVSGFITGLYVVITPLLGAAILRVRIGRRVWFAVGLATVGLGVLSLNGFSVGYGALLTLAASVIYAAHILAMSRMTTPGTTMSLTVVQTLVVAVVCALAAAPNGISVPSSGPDWMVVLYLGVVAGALTMFLQTWAQARIDATRAAVVMAMEPVWAAAFAVALGGELLTVRMVLGGLSILAAMYLVELTPSRLADHDRDPAPTHTGEATRPAPP